MPAPRRLRPRRNRAMNLYSVQLDYLNAARCFARKIGLKWPRGSKAAIDTAAYLCNRATQPEFADNPQAQRLLAAEKTMNDAKSG